MDDYKRHQKVWPLLYFLIHGWICRKFHETYEIIRQEGPILLIPNHVSAFDPLLVAMSLPEKQVYYVASEHLFRLGPVSRLIEWMVAPIPRRKAASGADTVKACLRHLRAGHSVCLFAEGEQSWNGRTSPIFAATGKLVKSSGATLVTYRLEGGYLSKPRWAKKSRRGAIYGHPVGIYPPEALKEMKPQEINALIERDISEDAWDRQRRQPILYRGKNLAEGLERALYLCPGCRKIGNLQTKGDQIFCSCGLKLRYTETGFFDPESPFPNLADWDDWQKECLRKRDYDYQPPLLFSDRNIRLSHISANHGERLLTEGELRQYEDRLSCGDFSWNLSEISNMADVLCDRLLFSADGEYYELQSDGSPSMRKYLETWKEKK